MKMTPMNIKVWSGHVSGVWHVCKQLLRIVWSPWWPLNSWQEHPMCCDSVFCLFAAYMGSCFCKPFWKFVVFLLIKSWQQQQNTVGPQPLGTMAMKWNGVVMTSHDYVITYRLYLWHTSQGGVGSLAELSCWQIFGRYCMNYWQCTKYERTLIEHTCKLHLHCVF